jgi:chromate transporter
MVSYFRLGGTTFGGMWAATQVIEAELVHRKKWLQTDDVQFLMLAANLIPAPRFLGFGGLVGYRLRGWPGGVVAVLSLVAPGGLLVLAAVAFISPDLLAGQLAPLRRALSVAVVGLLFGNAYQQLKTAKVSRGTRAIGVGLGLLVAGATVAGIPLLVTAIAGFAVGAVLIRAGRTAP